MITVDKTLRSNRYRIMESAISFTENYQNTNLKGSPIYDVVSVSLVGNASIMVYDPNNGIDYGDDLQYKRWRLKGATTGLVSPEAHYIYAKLSKSGSDLVGDVVFSTYKYTAQGVSEEIDGEGNPLKDYSETHWMIRIGRLSELTDPNEQPDRQLTFNPGQLGTQKDNNEKGGGWVADMFDLIMDNPNLIKVRLWFEDIKVKKESLFEKVVNFYEGIRIGKNANAKVLTSVATDTSADEDDDKAITTPSYVKAFSEARYLRYDIESGQSVAGPVTFEQDVTVKGNHIVGSSQSVGGNQSVGGDQSVGGVVSISSFPTTDNMALLIGDYFEQGDIIQGAAVTKDGIASFARVKTPSLQVYELMLNRKTAVQGEFIFSDGETVESVEDLGDGNYKLTVRSPYEGYITTFQKDDILYSNINRIGPSGESAKTGKCWMLVTNIEDTVIYATMYADDECPDGKNIAPMPYMNISRHGNRNHSKTDRQEVFIVSSENSNMVMLRGVDSPIVSAQGSYGVVIGKLPDTLLRYIKDDQGIGYVNGNDPYVYARGVIVQDLIMLDYEGKPIPTERYRGEWNERIAQGLVEGEEVYQSTHKIVDAVTYEGSLWRCQVSGTTARPNSGTAEWTLKVSKGDDATASIYTIKPSANIVYYRTADKHLSTENLRVTVGVSDSNGHYNIEDQHTIEAHGLSVYYAIDGEGTPILLNISPSALFELEDGSGVLAVEEGEGLWLEGESIDISAIKDNITLYLKNKDTLEDMAMYIIPVVKDGEEGQRGRMLYPAGYWNETETYAIENDAAPFVKYQPEGRKEPTYYVLVWEGGPITGVNPEDDYNYNNGTNWRPFSHYPYLHTDFLIADWAKFGSDKGAIFYDRFFFSQNGVDKDGNPAKYSDHQKDMFDKDKQLSGEYMPSLMMDMYTGTFRANKVAETYMEIPRYINGQTALQIGGYEIDFEQTYNIKGDNVSLVTMPQDRDFIVGGIEFKAQADTTLDGIKSIITHKRNSVWSSRLTMTYDKNYTSNSPIKPFGSCSEAAASAMLVCPTPRFLNPHAWELETVTYSDGSEHFSCSLKQRDMFTNPDGVLQECGYFIIHGHITNFILLEPGMTLKLRSCQQYDSLIKEDRLYWYVENMDDFGELPYKVGLELTYAFDPQKSKLRTLEDYAEEKGLSDWYNKFKLNTPGAFSGYSANTTYVYASKNICKLWEFFKKEYTYDLPDVCITTKWFNLDVYKNVTWEHFIGDCTIGRNLEDEGWWNNAQGV